MHFLAIITFMLQFLISGSFHKIFQRKFLLNNCRMSFFGIICRTEMLAITVFSWYNKSALQIKYENIVIFSYLLLDSFLTILFCPREKFKTLNKFYFQNLFSLF